MMRYAAGKQLLTCCNSYSHEGAIVFKEKAIPWPSRDEVLIQVKAVSLNPIDWKSANTGSIRMMTPSPCSDLSGVVIAKGPSANGPINVDDEVVTCVYPTGGALAEYVLAKEAEVGPKPSGWDHTQASALPMGAVTAQHQLSLAGQLDSNKKLVVIGASGAIGQMILTLARPSGVRIIAVASRAKHEVVKSMGGPNVEVCDYKTQDWVVMCKHGGPPDVVIDVSSQSPFWSYHKAAMAQARRFITPNTLDPSFNLCCSMCGPLCCPLQVLWQYYTCLCSCNICCCPLYCHPGMCVPWGRTNAGDTYRTLAQQAEKGELPINPLRIQLFPPQQVHMAYALSEKEPGSKPVIDMSEGIPAFS